MFKQVTHTLVALITISFMISVAHADRRTSLGGNMLIKDRDDTFVYPQLAVKYNRSISMDFGAQAGFGNAMLIAGPNKKSAIGIALNRGDSVQPIGDGSYVTSPELGMIDGSVLSLDYHTQDSVTPPTIADIFYAMKMGKNKLGFRLGFVNRSASQVNDGDPVGSNGVFGFRLSAGYSIGKKGDFVFDISNVSGKILKDEDEDEVEDASVMNIHLGGRYYIPQGKGFKLGTLFDFNMANVAGKQYSVDIGKPENSTSTIAVRAGVGPVYRNKEKKYTVAMHAHLGFISKNEEPSSEVKDDEIATTTILFPGFNMAMEYQIRDWLVFRSSASYNHVIKSSEEVNKTVSNDNGNSGFGWNAGLGFLMENIRIDGTLSHGFVTAGPQFMGDNAQGLFSLVSATAKF